MADSVKKREPIQSSMGRPKTGPLGSFSPLIVQQIKDWRSNNTYWGAKTLNTELRKCVRFEGLDIPSCPSIARFLRKTGAIKKAYVSRVSDAAIDKLSKAERPHQRWQIDAKGNEEIEQLGAIGLINIKDTFTGIYTGTFPAYMSSLKSSPKATDYRLALRLSFCEHGLPEQIQTDHASVFYSNQQPSPFPTLFHLWLVGLGIKLIYSRVRKPTDQGQVERQHQTIWLQICRKSGYMNWQQLFAYCDQRRKRLNFDIPCSTLGNKAPLEVFPEHYHSGRPYRPEMEKQLFDLKRVDQYLAQNSWWRKVGANGRVKIAKQTYTVKQTNPGDLIKAKFNPFTRYFEFNNSDNLHLDCRPAKGLDQSRIMGGTTIDLPLGFQLQIPFNSQAESRLRLYETSKVTSK